MTAMRKPGAWRGPAPPSGGDVGSLRLAGPALPFAPRRCRYGGPGSGSHRGVVCAGGGSGDRAAGHWRGVRSWVPATPSRRSEPPSPLPPSFRLIRHLHPPLPPPLSARRSGGRGSRRCARLDEVVGDLLREQDSRIFSGRSRARCRRSCSRMAAAAARPGRAASACSCDGQVQIHSYLAHYHLN